MRGFFTGERSWIRLMGFLPVGSGRAVGLELDTGTVRAVQLQGSARRPMLVAAAQVDIPETAVVDGVVADVNAVAEALERLWISARFRSREVVLGAPEQGVLIRLGAFPAVPEAKLAQAVRFQAGDYFPIPVSQLVLDQSVVGVVEGEDGPAREVLMVAARRDLLEKSLEALTAARLTPKIADAPSLALLRNLAGMQLAGTVAMVNLSNGSSSLLLISGGVPRFARVIPVSLQDYARERGCPLAEVVPPTGSRAAPVDLGEWGMVLAYEIRSSIRYFLGRQEAADVELMVLGGRGARVPGLVEFLEAELEIRVELVKPPSGLVEGCTSGAAAQLEWPDHAVSMGLALRGLEA